MAGESFRGTDSPNILDAVGSDAERLLEQANGGSRPVSEQVIDVTEALSAEVKVQVREFFKALSRWPTIALTTVGICLIATDFFIEVFASTRLSSTEYVATLITGAALCVIGVGFEISRTQQARKATETGIGAVAGQVPDVVLAEITRALRVAAGGDPPAEEVATR